MKNILKYILPERLKRNVKERLGVPSQENCLKRIKALGFNPTFCLDIGAYEGGWATDFKRIFPNSNILMIEGQREKENHLAKITEIQPRTAYIIALLGASEQMISFNKYETASSVLTEHFDTDAKTETRQLLTLDSIMNNSSFGHPDFIKIDTQGYELEILKGGEKTLTQAEFVLLEVSFLDIYKNCPLAVDVLYYMNSRGFVLYDICSLMRRPLDDTLYQSDFLFVKETSRYRSDKRWK